MTLVKEYANRITEYRAHNRSLCLTFDHGVSQCNRLRSFQQMALGQLAYPCAEIMNL